MRAVTLAVVMSLCTAPLMAQGGVDVQLQRIVETARAKGLPTEPIVAKAQQGVVMRTPAPRIVAAAQAVATRLEEAREALAPNPTTNDIVAGQDALSINGVTKDALAAVRAASPGQPIVVPVGVLAQLIASGVSPRRATDIVTTLVRKRATSAQLVALGNDVNGDVSRGGSAEGALENRLRRLAPLLAAPTPAAAAAGIQMMAPTPPKKP